MITQRNIFSGSSTQYVTLNDLYLLSYSTALFVLLLWYLEVQITT